MTFQEFAHKKVLGVPVLYVAGGAVIILAVVAWKMKASTPPVDTSTDAQATNGSAADNAIDGSQYAGLDTQGTVTVAPQPTPAPSDANSSITTNDEWVSKGVIFLTQQKHVDGTLAYEALSRWVNGQDYTADQKTLIDEVFTEYGPPPDGGGGGAAGNKPAQKQGNPPTTHSVTGSNDNKLAYLATLYYGSSDLAHKMDLIQGDKANASIGGGPYPIGTKVFIPLYHEPKYYVTTVANMTKSQVASKNGITVEQLAVYNNGPNFDSKTAFSKGTKLRVG